MKFPYSPYVVTPSPTVPTGVIHRPEIPMRIVGSTGIFPAQALVDPGSDDTLLPLSIGQLVGAAMDASQTWHAEGIGGQSVLITAAEIVLELTDGKQTFRWPARVGVVDFADPKDEVMLLGHAGFLEFFRTTFDGHQRHVEIEVTPAFPGQVV